MVLGYWLNEEGISLVLRNWAMKYHYPKPKMIKPKNRLGTVVKIALLLTGRKETIKFLFLRLEKRSPKRWARVQTG